MKSRLKKVAALSDIETIVDVVVDNITVTNKYYEFREEEAQTQFHPGNPAEIEVSFNGEVDLAALDIDPTTVNVEEMKTREDFLSGIAGELLRQTDERAKDWDIATDKIDLKVNLQGSKLVIEAYYMG